jgi:hypothetical protein
MVPETTHWMVSGEFHVLWRFPIFKITPYGNFNLHWLFQPKSQQLLLDIKHGVVQFEMEESRRSATYMMPVVLLRSCRVK